MFDHPGFRKNTFENIPLNIDIFIMDARWLDEYEKSWVEFFKSGGDYVNVGYISYAAARSVSSSAVDLSWYPNIIDRFHEVRISLPRDQFVACVGCYDYDEKPHLFVKNEWSDQLHLRSYSIFALIDASDVKNALKSGSVTREKLIQLRDRIDAISVRYPDISFISFGDSVLLKSNWRVGKFDSEVKYNYEPEIFIRLILEIQSAYREALGLAVYAVLTQGSNAYYDDPLLHTSASKNHISLNSLGLPFAQLMAIEKSARIAVKRGKHDRAEIYMDENFFRSLKLTLKFQSESCGKSTYQVPLIDEEGLYYFADCKLMLTNLLKKT